MKKYTLNIGVDAIAAYNYFGSQPLSIPPSWPHIKYHLEVDSLFLLSPEEIHKQYGLSFPVNWSSVKEDIKAKVGNKLSYNNFLHHFPQKDIDLNIDTVESFAKSNTPYVYIFNLPNSNIFNLNVFNLNPIVKQQLNKNLVKVLFYFGSEGYITAYENHGLAVNEWLNKFAILNGINKEDLLLSHSNIIFSDILHRRRIEQKYTYIPINYFEHNPWFIKHGSPHEVNVRENLLPFLNRFIEENRNKKIRNYFNILNRRPHLHRILLFTEVMSNPTLKEKSEISLGNEHIRTHDEILKFIKILIKRYPNLEWEKNYEFAKDHNFNQQVTLDVDLMKNRASNQNRDFYKKTFCSIITETKTTPETLFLSEKIFKPIFNLHPFITLGNKGTMKYLRECGYKTFSNWWSEDYDEIDDEFLRLKRISAIMEDICSWPESKLIEVTQEMEETLIHNFTTFLYNKRYLNFIEKLTFPNYSPATNRKLAKRPLI